MGYRSRPSHPHQNHNLGGQYFLGHSLYIRLYGAYVFKVLTTFYFIFIEQYTGHHCRERSPSKLRMLHCYGSLRHRSAYCTASLEKQRSYSSPEQCQSSHLTSLLWASWPLCKSQKRNSFAMINFAIWVVLHLFPTEFLLQHCEEPFICLTSLFVTKQNFCTATDGHLG